MIEFTSPLLIVWVEVLLVMYSGFCQGAFWYDISSKGERYLTKWLVRMLLAALAICFIEYMQIQTTNAVEYGRMLGGSDG